jgi:Tesmin/TSO1-like CXC domain, cysteine-rich domain
MPNTGAPRPKNWNRLLILLCQLYCECFSAGVHCNAYCSCSSCYNDGSVEHQSTRNKAILDCLARNPYTFRATVVKATSTGSSYSPNMDVVEAVVRSTSTRPKTFCTCNKSRCLKVSWRLTMEWHMHRTLTLTHLQYHQKYCECFRRDDYCTGNCKCSQCQNVEGYPEREALATKKNPRSTGPSAAPGSKTARTANATETMNSQQPEESEFVSPSHNAVPMNLPGDVASTTLAFGRGVTFKKAKTEASGGGVPGAFERAMATEEAVLARRKATDGGPGSSTRQKKQKRELSLQKDLELHWSDETRDVLGTFQAMRQELLQRKQDAGLLSADIILSREYSYYDLVASAQLASVELDLADVLASVREAEGRAQSLIAKTSQQPAKENAMPKTLSQSRRAGLISEAVQDTALMRELARIIRSRAFEMSESRKDGYKL